MTRWNQGRATIDALIAQGAIERVPASQQSAEAELERSRTHLTSARQLLATDPEGAYTLAYDAVLAQLAPPLGSILRPFNRMRARRNEVEYRSWLCRRTSVRRSSPPRQAATGWCATCSATSPAAWRRTSAPGRWPPGRA